MFRADLCSSDADLGDLLIHEGPALAAQKHAARVFHADKTYFVLNGTSTSNKIVTNTVLAPGDIVLYDRNNHKSIDLDAFVLAGAIPVYLETARKAYGSIGGIPSHCLEEEYFPPYAMSPIEAEGEYIRGHGELIDLEKAEGRIALEGALPYPPGILCVHPGEVWTKTAVDYFRHLVEGINQLPGFAPELQGVYVEDGDDDRKHAYGYVLRNR